LRPSVRARRRISAKTILLALDLRQQGRGSFQDGDRTTHDFALDVSLPALRGGSPGVLS
jgi:hypothetical protein